MNDFGIGHMVFLIALYFLVVRPIMSGYRRAQDEGLASGLPAGDLPSDPINSAKTRWASLGDYDVEVVGESNYQRHLSKLAGNHGTQSANTECVARLIPEDSNAFDSKAIAVEVAGETVGYLSKENARSFRHRLSDYGLEGTITTCNALVVGGATRESGEKLFYGVKLDLEPFD